MSEPLTREWVLQHHETCGEPTCCYDDAAVEALLDERDALAEEVKASITGSFRLVDELKAENAALRAALERQAVGMCLRFGRGRGSPDACDCCQEVHAAARKALGQS